MEERQSYLDKGIKDIIWVECNKSLYDKISDKNSDNEKVFNLLISDVDNKTEILKITNNTQSSSILDLDRHKIFHPDVVVTETIEMKSTRMDSLINDENIDITKYNFINLDIQGAELLALKGFGDYLNHFKFIYTEVNTSHVYKDCAVISEIDDYLSNYGFIRYETQITGNEWGDAIYIKL
jgi:FkbM family methyltransferase